MNHVIELERVSKTFGNFNITDLSLQVNKGYVTGFIGANELGSQLLSK